MNFRRDLVYTTKCVEGWENQKHIEDLFPSVRHRTKMMKRLNQTAYDQVFKPPGVGTRHPGNYCYIDHAHVNLDNFLCFPIHMF